MNLTNFTTRLRNRKELLDLHAPFAGRLEVAALTDWVCKHQGPALYFKQLVDSDVQLVTNLFGSASRMATALEQDRLDGFGDGLKRAFNTGGSGDSASRLGSLKAHDISMVIPGDMQCQSDLSLLPQIRFWPEEQRSFYTLAVVITADTETAAQNYGLYRIGFAGGNQLTLNLLPGSGGREHLQQWQERRRPMPVAILLGADPSLIFCAAASLPQTCDEALFSGWIQGKAVPFITGQTVPLRCPASSQLRIEGWVDAETSANEGPFGCYTGRYGGGNDCPLVKISAVYAVEHPLIPLTVAGPLPMEDSWLARANLELIRARLSIDVPAIRSIAMPLDAAFFGLYFVKLNDEQVSAAEVASQLRRLDYLTGLKMLVMLEQDESLDEELWRRQVQQTPSLRIWQEGAAILKNLLEPQVPQLQHDPVLVESLLQRLERVGIYPDELCGGSVV